MAILKFETNIPQIVCLAFSEGKPVVSPKTGAQLMFSTTDSNVFYVPPIVGEKLKEKGVVARQQIQLCKRQVGNRMEWQVETHNAAAGVVLQATPTAAPVRLLNGSTTQEYNGNAHRDHGDDPTTPRSQWSQSTAQMRSKCAPREQSMTIMERQAAPRGNFSPRAELMMAAMLDAVDVITETEMFLERRGLEFEPARFEDVRAIAATFFIQDCKGGAR